MYTTGTPSAKQGGPLPTYIVLFEKNLISGWKMDGARPSNYRLP